MFLALSLGLSWALFALTVPRLREHGFSQAGAGILALHLLATWCPSLVALALAGRGERGGARRLWRALFSRPPRWWRLLVPLFLYSALAALLVGILALGTGMAVSWEPKKLLWLPLAWLAALPFGPLGEELGWRGYAQPRLLPSLGPVGTGCVIGLFWCLWHWPLFWAPGGTPLSDGDFSGLGLLSYLLLLMGLSVIMAQLTGWAGSGLQVGVLMHLDYNVEPYTLWWSLDGEMAAQVERWSFLPVWLLVLLLVVLGKPHRGLEITSKAQPADQQ